ncbi:stage III sporulation protein AA [Anaerostipes hadrus]|nr:stage III sporulation protein AA [Anaerostipes hadrus]
MIRSHHIIRRKNKITFIKTPSITYIWIIPKWGGVFKFMKEEEILGILPLHIRTIIKQAGINWDELQEIRLRIQKPVILKYNAKTCYLSEQGKITTRKEQLHIVTSQEIRQAMEYISSYSMYAYIEQLKQGFLTIRGGHRVGICGTVVMDHDKVKTIRHISGLNIRVAHEVKGCADILYSRCTRMGKLIPTLIISPPGCGKTTLLRDMIRKISDEGQTVGVVDERSEIGACYQGVAQNDLGIQTDVMDACEKGQGMNMLIRSMAPDVIAVDEIGSKEDVEALFFCAYRGCSILATAHGKNKESLSKNPYMREIINKKMFQRYVILEQRNQPGYIAQIMDENGVVLN